MERFSPSEVAKQKAPEQETKKKKSVKRTQKYITKIVNGEKHMVLNPNYTFKHND